MTGRPAAPLCYDVPWYVHWAHPGAHHPAWLDASSFEELARRRHGVPGAPEELERPRAGFRQALLARKFSTEASSDLLDRIDAELRPG